MKIRQGFVSNSSSASFVIIWKNNTGLPFGEAIKHIIMPWDSDSRTDNKKEYIEEVIKATFVLKEDADEQFLRTYFWTVMDNGDPEDFGRAAMVFNMALDLHEVNKSVKVISREINGD